MKTYTIIGGVNGVGKSSMLGILKECTTSLGIIIDPEKIAAKMGISVFAGGRVAVKKIRDCLNRDISFTQETTLSGRKTEVTARAAKERGYHIRLYYVALDSAEESMERIQNRVRHGGHDIPQEDVLRRFDGRWEAVAKVLVYCDEAMFYDNSNGFVKVAEYRSGEIRAVGSAHPAWLDELLRQPL